MTTFLDDYQYNFNDKRQVTHGDFAKVCYLLKMKSLHKGFVFYRIDLYKYYPYLNSKPEYDCICKDIEGNWIFINKPTGITISKFRRWIYTGMESAITRYNKANANKKEQHATDLQIM